MRLFDRVARILLVGVSLLIVTAMGDGDTPPEDPEASSACSPQPGRHVVAITSPWDGDVSAAEQLPLNHVKIAGVAQKSTPRILIDPPLEPGVYAVALVSYDGHLHDGQRHESWRTRLFSDTGEISGDQLLAAADIPDDRSSEVSEQPGLLVLEEPATRLMAEHWVDQSRVRADDDLKKSSVWALCAVFTLAGDPRLIVEKSLQPRDGRAESDSGSLPEGDPWTVFSLSVRNTDSVAARIEQLVDDEFGALDGIGTCAIGVLLQPGERYSCSFTERLADANAGAQHANSVTAETDRGARGSASASVRFTNLPPTVRLTATPELSVAPGGSIEVVVEIENSSGVTDPVTVMSLDDERFGDLLAPGPDVIRSTCAAQRIEPGEAYRCTFSVRAPSCEEESSVVRVVVVDDDADLSDGVSQLDDAHIARGVDPYRLPLPACPGAVEAVLSERVDFEVRGGTGTFSFVITVVNLGEGHGSDHTVQLRFAGDDGRRVRLEPFGAVAPERTSAGRCGNRRLDDTGLSFVVEDLAPGEVVECIVPAEVAELSARTVVVDLLVNGELTDAEVVLLAGSAPGEGVAALLADTRVLAGLIARAEATAGTSGNGGPPRSGLPLTGLHTQGLVLLAGILGVVGASFLAVSRRGSRRSSRALDG